MNRLRSLAVAAGVVVSCLVALSGAVAQADTVPPLQYPPKTISAPWSPNLTSSPDGSVTIGCQGGTSGRDLTTYGPTGDIVRNFDRTQLIDGVQNCISRPVVDKNGALYGIPDNGSYVYAFSSSSIKWKYPFGCGAAKRQVVAIGPNGVIYGLTTINNQVHLVGLAPEVAAGQTQPKVVLDVVVSYNCLASVLPYNDGILVRDEASSNSNYYSYGGKLLFTIPAPPNSGLPVMNESGQFLTYSFNGVQRYIHIVDPILGHAVWTYRLLDTSDILRLYPTSSGGAVAHISEPATPGIPSSKVQKLVAIDSSGVKLWEYALKNLNGSPSTLPEVFVVSDESDRIALVRQVVATTADGRSSRAISVSVMRVQDGAILYQQLLMGNTDTAANSTAYILYGPPTAANGTLSFAVTCHGYSCPTPAHRLYALSVSSIGMDYPRGKVLGMTAPSAPTTFKRYVGLGDSVSSGQGAGYYDSSTVVPGTNTCYRATGAYPRILARSGNSALKLDAFVACGGAKAHEITNKWPAPDNQAENPQVSAVTSQTEVITLTIGGNDIKFSDFVKGCLANQCDAAYATSSALINSTLSQELDGAYTAILAKGTKARLYVIGYPPMLTAQSGSCTRAFPFDTAHNRDLAVSLLTQLNQKIRDKVLEVSARTPRIQYVDPMEAGSPFAGHDLCSSTPYYNGITPSDANDSFHPNQLGHLAYASLVAKHLVP